MSTSAATPIGVRHLVAALVTHADDSLPTLVMALAKQGHLDLLQGIFADGLINPSSWAGDKHMAYAILPLARHVHPDELAAARTLVQEWVAAFRGADLADLGAYFIISPDADISRELLALGVDPLAPAGIGYKETIRECVCNQGNGKSMLALLESAVRSGDGDCIGLVLKVFAYSFRQDQDIGSHWAWQQAAQCGLIEKGAEHIGKHLLPLLRKLVKEQNDQRVPLNAATLAKYVRRWLQMMTWCELSPGAWHEVLSLGTDDCQLASIMAADTRLSDLAVSVIQCMARAGVTGDMPNVHCKGTTYPGTMLHAAMLANNVPVVLALLDAGADPTATLHIHGKRKDAASVAPKSREAVQALTAWRAQRAMRRVVQSDSTKPRTDQP